MNQINRHSKIWVGSARLAIVNLSLWGGGSACLMTVAELCAIDCDRKSEMEKSRNELIFRSVYSACAVSI